MKEILVFLLSIVAVVLVRYGPGDSETPDRFISLPLTVDEAKSQSWNQESRVDKALPSLVLYCHPTFIICVMYDDTLYAAGIQIALPEKNLQDTLVDPTLQGYLKWIPSNGKSYWVKDQYFVDQEFLKTDAKQRVAKRNPETLLQAGSVWVSGNQSELIEVTPTPEGLPKEFIELGCYNRMGVHCKQRELLAAGLGIGARLDPADLPKDWFERPDEQLARAFVPDGPQCIYDLPHNPGFVTIHVYYVDEPWKITC
ncbi:hypothetical protein NE865_15588 [Phthorimaea operculella]|nr:hypothetical protein NE865_15588 [Phthorimaea operculella]